MEGFFRLKGRYHRKSPMDRALERPSRHLRKEKLIWKYIRNIKKIKWAGREKMVKTQRKAKSCYGQGVALWASGRKEGRRKGRRNKEELKRIRCYHHAALCPLGEGALDRRVRKRCSSNTESKENATSKRGRDRRRNSRSLSRRQPRILRSR